MTAKGFDDFIPALREAGFSLGGGNSENVFSLFSERNDERFRFDGNAWHTGDSRTDPWEWRMRVLEEVEGIAYAKVFFRKSGYITREWYPYFLAARRGGNTLDGEYWDGSLSSEAKRIYEVIREHNRLPLHVIKKMAHFGKAGASSFEKALVDLQMKMYITMCGRQPKITADGSEYGWSSTVFCAVEKFFDAEVFEAAARITVDEAAAKITAQVYRLNPAADERKILKFIRA